MKIEAPETVRFAKAVVAVCNEAQAALFEDLYIESIKAERRLAVQNYIAEQRAKAAHVAAEAKGNAESTDE